MVSYILSLKEYMSWYLNIDTIQQFYINLGLVDNTLQCKEQVILQYGRRYDKKETLFIL